MTSPRSRPVAVLSTALVVLLLGTACAASGENATGSKGYISGDGQIVLIDEADRPTLPKLTGSTLTGEPFDTTDYAGSPMAINVWASWCGPCRAEADDLVGAAQRLDGVSFVGINTRDDPSAAAAFVRSNGITYPSLLDESGSELLEFYGLYNLKALPTTMVIDAEGHIAAIVTDAITETTLIDLVQEVSEA